MFLPTDYEAPKLASTSYTKLQEGENRVRILSKPILGWEDWKDKKPLRFRMNEKPKPLDPAKPVKHFWAFIVYNYGEGQIQIMQINQATVRKSLESLSKDKDWGSPFDYDIKIVKTGEGKETEYTINPVPHKPVGKDVLDAFQKKQINLQALFDSIDPFAPGQSYYTPLMPDEPESKIEPIAAKISVEEAEILNALLKKCDAATNTGFHTFMKSKYKIEDVEHLPKMEFGYVKETLETRINKK